jgi:hypothetical protein
MAGILRGLGGRGKKDLTAFPAKFIARLVFRPALGASGVEFSPAFPAEPAIFLILGPTSGTYKMMGFHKRVNPFFHKA